MQDLDLKTGNFSLAAGTTMSILDNPFAADPFGAEEATDGVADRGTGTILTCGVWRSLGQLVADKELVDFLVRAKCTTLHACELKLFGAAAERVAIALAANTSVRTLRLNECDVDNKVGSLLAEALEEKRQRSFGENRCLRVLSLCRNRIGPAGAAKLAEVLKTNNSLTKLDLSKNPLGDARQFCFGDSRDEGAENLAAGLCQSRALSSLDLQVTQIGDAGAVALAASLREARLRELHLRDNLTLRMTMRVRAIGDKGAQSLADALHCSTLALLDLSFNRHIGALGVQKLTEAVEQSDTITVLAVHGFRRSRQEITRLEAALDKNKRTQVLTLHCIPDGELCKASCTQMSGAELLELSLAPETPLWQVFASVAEAMTQPADSLRLITSAGQDDTGLRRRNNRCS
eukprot:s166_g29.t1